LLKALSRVCAAGAMFLRENGILSGALSTVCAPKWPLSAPRHRFEICVNLRM